MQIGSGGISRSVVRQLVVDFDADVLVDTNAFLLQKRTTFNGSPVLDTVTTSFALATLPSGATRATLSFSGVQTYTGGSLSDGYYQLTIFGASVCDCAAITRLTMATVMASLVATMCWVRSRLITLCAVR